MTTLTAEQFEAIRQRVASTPNIPSGVGTKDAACSLATINLALTGQLTDEIPDCMSKVIGRWIVVIQDAMPAAMRNSPEWREALPYAAGTGRDPRDERARLDLILSWMWDALALVEGQGEAWARTRTLCRPCASSPAIWSRQSRRPMATNARSCANRSPASGS